MFIFAATRTPFCRIGGELSSLSGADLGKAAATSLLVQTGIDPARISETIFGCAFPTLNTANVARAIALRSGVPGEVPSCSVQRGAASGLEALALADYRIKANRGDLFLVGATESMSSIPLLFPPEAALHFAGLDRAKTSSQKITAAAHFSLSDFRPKIGLEMAMHNPVSNSTLSECAERIAREGGISRDEQDDYAERSHARAAETEASRNSEISPIFLGSTCISEDPATRDLSILRNRPPLHDMQTGSVTAGNTSHHADGAATFLVGTKEAGKNLGLEPKYKIISYASSGSKVTHPEIALLTAVRDACALAKLDIGQIGVWEINESSAAIVLFSIRNLNLPDTVNFHGGAIALGDPVGTSAARMTMSAMGQLRESHHRYALIATPINGGQASAMIIKNLEATTES